MGPYTWKVLNRETGEEYGSFVSGAIMADYRAKAHDRPVLYNPHTKEYIYYPPLP